MASKKIPDRWMEYKAIGSKIAGTRFIAFKTPLKKEICMKMAPVERFTPQILMERCSLVKLVVDLTNTDRYYDKQELIDNGVRHKKIMCPGRVLPPNNLVYRFFDIVDQFFEINEMNDALIGIHCTHGVNRTAYFIGRYMIQRMGFPFEKTINCIQDARGHNIERLNYIRDLELKISMPNPRNLSIGKKNLNYTTMTGREDDGPREKDPFKEGPKENRSRYKNDGKGPQGKLSGEDKVRRGVEGGGRGRSPFKKIGGNPPKPDPGSTFNRGRHQSPRRTGENLFRNHNQGHSFYRERQESPRRIGGNLLRGHPPEGGFSGERRDPPLEFRYGRSRSPRRRISPAPLVDHFQSTQDVPPVFHRGGNVVWEKEMDPPDILRPQALQSYRPPLEKSHSQWTSPNPFDRPQRRQSPPPAPWRIPNNQTYPGPQSILPSFQEHHFPPQEHRPAMADHRYPPFRSPDRRQVSPERLHPQQGHRILPRDQNFFPISQDHNRPPLQTFNRTLDDRRSPPPVGERQHFMEPRLRSPGSPYPEHNRRLPPTSDVRTSTHFKVNSPIRQRTNFRKESPLRDTYRPRERSPPGKDYYEDRFRNDRGLKPFGPHDETKEDNKFGKFYRRPSPDGGFRSFDERWRGSGPPGGHKEVRREPSSFHKTDPIYDRDRRSRSPLRKEVLDSRDRGRRSSPIYQPRSGETSPLVYSQSSPVRPSSDDCRDLLNMKRSMVETTTGTRNLQSSQPSREKPLLTVKDLPKEVDLRNLLQADQKREASIRKKQPPVWNRLGRSPSPKFKQSKGLRGKRRNSPVRKQKKF